MGIKNFNKLLKEQAPNTLTEKNLNEFENKTIAIDTSLVLYQYISALRNTGKDLEDDNGNMTTHIYAIIQNVFYFLDRKIKPVYIFDGKAPSIKKFTLEQRKKIKKNAEEKKKNAKNKEEEIKFFKRTLYLTKQHFNECISILNIMGIPYFQAEGEADCLCSYLVKNKLVDMAYSEDMDFLTFGSLKVLKKFKSNKVIDLDLNLILSELKIDYNSFINLTILLGCDYAPTIKGIGYKTAYKIIIKHKTIENFIKDNTKYTIPDNYNYKDIIEYYKNPPISKKKYDIVFNIYDSKKLKEELTKYNFSINIINKYINKLKKINIHDV